jgi:5-amino-6-(5-phosphoribosylamino)uracil reductase
VVISRSLEGIDPTWSFFTAQDVKRVLFVSENLGDRQKAFEATSEVVLLKPQNQTPAARQIVQHLEAKGVQNLVIEGGGAVMWDFVNENLIDEYHVTLVPRILGGADAPTLVEGKGFTPEDVLNVKLKECRVVQNEIYLTYVKTNSRGKELPT